MADKSILEIQTSAEEIARLLFLNSLEKDEEDKVIQFVNDYLQLLDNHLHDNDSKTSLEKLQAYENVINIIYNDYDDFNPDNYPAIGIIKSIINNYYHKIDENLSMIRTLKPNNYGFAKIFIIVGATIIMGIFLGSLLWFIR